MFLSRRVLYTFDFSYLFGFCFRDAALCRLFSTCLIAFFVVSYIDIDLGWLSEFGLVILKLSAFMCFFFFTFRDCFFFVLVIFIWVSFFVSICTP